MSHKKNSASKKSATNNQIMVDDSIIHKDNVDINYFIGKCFNNRYLIETHLGTGGMSEVFRAIDLELQNANIQEPYVALKILQSKFNDQFDAKKILMKESFKTQKLSHPNIIRVYSAGSDNEHHYMIMEWLDGESLDQLINRSKPYGIPFNKAKSIIKKVSSGLKYAHSLGIIHTDLKPSNIFLTLKGEVKIFDFGVAGSIQLNYNPYALEEKSETCIVEGHTPAYASLEQLNDKPPCIEDDVFAFSCIIYELISSKHPYKRIAMNKISKKDLNLIKPMNINLIQWRALKQGLAQKKVDRTVSIEKLEKQLNKKYFNKVISLILISSILIFSGYIYNEKNIEIKDLNQIIYKLKHKKAGLPYQAKSANSEETQDSLL
ncbi:MAG: serine/threonine protein kinase [Psychromonas sp.]|nr:serine/threonine protein kinase [Psychromonas sp.]